MPIVSKNGIKADPEKTNKVKHWPLPRNKKEVQQFLGFANYYWRFIKSFAEIAKALHKVTELSTAPFQWIPECQRSFDLLRNLLSSPPIVVYPDFTKPFILDTDTSNEGIGAVLSQLDSQGKERVIAYGSRLLAKAKRNYCATERSFLLSSHSSFTSVHTFWGTNFNYELTIVPYKGFTGPRNRKDKLLDGWKNCSSYTNADCCIQIAMYSVWSC